ncbi:MAG: hypothetical protein PHE83_17560 [Opitutaceae bacterium]|nr:hypothetical protein [Opitutaceae bacterium]
MSEVVIHDRRPEAAALAPSPELALPGLAPPAKRPLIVHLPKLWTTEWAIRLNWTTRNFDEAGREIAAPPPPPFMIEEGPQQHLTVMIGGMQGPRSKKFVAERHLTLAEVRLLAGLLSFRPPWSSEFSLGRLELRPLYRRIKTGPDPRDMAGGHRIQSLRDDLEHLETFWVLSDRPWKVGEAQKEADKLIRFRKATQYRAGFAHTEANIQAEWIEAFSMNRDFLRVIDDTGRAIRLDVFNSFESDMVRLWYLVVPALASHQRITPADPWKRNLRDLFAAAGCAFGSWKAKAWRYERCARHVRMLDGAETMNGRLRVSLALNSAGDDYLLCAWIERTQGGAGRLHYNRDGYLYSYWIESGRSQEEFEERLRRGLGPLSGYEVELLDASGYPYKQGGNQTFLRQIRALMGESAFALALGQAKVSVLEYRMVGGCNPGRIVGTVLKDYYRRALAPR